MEFAAEATAPLWSWLGPVLALAAGAGLAVLGVRLDLEWARVLAGVLIFAAIITGIILPITMFDYNRDMAIHEGLAELGFEEIGGDPEEGFSARYQGEFFRGIVEDLGDDRYKVYSLKEAG